VVNKVEEWPKTVLQFIFLQQCSAKRTGRGISEFSLENQKKIAQCSVRNNIGFGHQYSTKQGEASPESKNHIKHNDTKYFQSPSLRIPPFLLWKSHPEDPSLFALSLAFFKMPADFGPGTFLGEGSRG
jgi:hypothetical protein